MFVTTPGSTLTPRTTINLNLSDKASAVKEKETEEAHKLKEFVQDGGHFSLVR